MTTSTETTATAAANGTAPGPADDSAGAGPAATASERVMGVIGIAFAVGLLLIGLDLATGGAISRLFGAQDDSAGG